MRKIFTLALAAVALNSTAANRSWDFTKWSEATVNNLKAVNAANTTWSDIEKADGSSDSVGENCFWQVSVEATVIDGVLTANDVAIEETKGLKFVVESDGKVKDRSLAIAVNYPSTSLGEYHGPAYLWLGGKQIDYFVIPAVAGGATIKMGIESHKSTDPRGVKLLVNGEALEGPEVPTTFVEQTWTVPAGEAVDVTVQNTNGCHIYYIDVIEETPSAHTWDFTKWSEATVNNLKAVNAANTTWSDIEKADGSSDSVGENCFWQVSVEATVIDGVLTANDVAIEETKGLKFVVESDGKVKDRSLAIAVNYPSTSLGEYHGPAYLWLGGKQIDYFVIPAVAGGATIKMGIESHKSTDPRGVKLLVNGEALEGPEVPTTFVEQTWTVPAGEAVDVTVQNTNGCHIYYIDVVDPSGVSGIEADENAPVEYYNLQGVRVANPENGIFIRRQGKKVTKVMMK